MPKRIRQKPDLNIPSYPKPSYAEVCVGKFSHTKSFNTLRIRFWKSVSKNYRKAKYLASLFENYIAPSSKNDYWTEIIINNESEFYKYYDVLSELHMLIFNWKYVEHYIGTEICYSDEFWIYMWKLNKCLFFPNIAKIDVQEKIREFNDKWRNEKDLFLIVQSICSNYSVKRHYRTPWLDGLELDIFIEDLKIGIEYQGIQHYVPIDHWGGKDGFIKRQSNDIKKKHLCEKNEVQLVYFTYQEKITPELVLERLLPYLEET